MLSKMFIFSKTRMSTNRPASMLYLFFLQRLLVQCISLMLQKLPGSRVQCSLISSNLTPIFKL